MLQFNEDVTVHNLLSSHLFFCVILFHPLLISSRLSLAHRALMHITAAMVLSSGTSVSIALIKQKPFKILNCPTQSFTASDSSSDCHLSVYNVKDINLANKSAKACIVCGQKLKLPFISQILSVVFRLDIMSYTRVL